MAGFLIVMMGILALLGVAVLIVGQFWQLFCYIMEGISLQRIAKRRKLENPWLAWVPVARSWLLGAVSDHYRQGTEDKPTNRRKGLLVLRILSNGLRLVGFGGVLIALALLSYHDALEMDFNTVSPVTRVILILGGLFLHGWCAAEIGYRVYAYFAIYDLYLSSSPEKAVRRLLLSIFLPVTPFLVYACRNDDAGLPPETQEE